MPASVPRDSTLAVVGDGFGALLVYATAIYLGFRPEEIGIFGDNNNPVGTYQQFARNLGRPCSARSRSRTHPRRLADVRPARRLVAAQPRAALPLDRRKYNPGVPDILTEASVVPRRLG